MENQGTSNPFIFFSPGVVLSNKDREINSDLVEIHKFFAPIDNLFGDYESRKKYGLERNIFRRLYSKSDKGDVIKNIRRRTDLDILASIKPVEWKKYFEDEASNTIINSVINLEAEEQYRILEEEIIILTREDFKVHKDKLLVIYLIYDNTVKDMVVDYDFIYSKLLRLNYEHYFHQKTDSVELKDGIPTGDKISQIFVIDPIKINEIIHNCESNFDNQLKNLELEGFDKSLILKAILKIKGALYQKMADPSNTSIWRITDTNVYELFWGEMKTNPLITKPNDKNLHLYLANLFCTRKIKMKSIEKFNFLRIRIGWQNNRYILYLHPYESESNNPIRIPSE